MTAENNSDGKNNASTNEYDYAEIIRSGRELINSVYERFSRHILLTDETGRTVRAAGARPSLNRYLDDVDDSLRQIDRFVFNMGTDESNESRSDNSAEIVDLVNMSDTPRNRTRSHHNVIDFVDLCSPTATDRRVSQSSDVEITGVQQLAQTSSTNRRRKLPKTSNNNHERNEDNDLNKAEGSSKVARISDSSIDNTESPNESGAYKCPICLEFVKSRCPTTTKCGHIFCKECINAVLKVKSNARKCPLCTKKIGVRDLVRIYF